MGSSYYKNIVYKEKEDKFSDLSLNKDKIEGRSIAINNNYLAMSWVNCDIVLVNSSKPCKINKEHPHIKYNYSKSNDIEFSPFNNNILVSAYDNSVVLWKIPNEDIKVNITKEFQIYKKHTKKVTNVTFNPAVDNILCSGALGNEIHIWNPEKGDNYIEFKSVDNPSMISWNPNGNLVGVSTKNKFINIFDPRSNKLILKQNINEDFVSPKFGWIDNSLFVTTGYENKRGKKMLKLWDIRKQSNNNLLNEGEITSIKIDGSKSDILIPLINKELKIIYVIGKEKTSNNAYIYNEGKFEKIKTYAPTASICSVLLDRKYLDKKGTEMDIFANVTQDYKCIYYSSFILPKKKPINNITLFPDENNIVLSYEEWIKGKNLDKNNDKGEIVNENNINIEEKNNNNQSQQKIINKKDEKKQNKDVNKNEKVEILNSKENKDKGIETKIKGIEKKTNEINTQNLTKIKVF